MSEKAKVFEDYGIEAEIGQGPFGRYARWNLGLLQFPNGDEVKITAITNESKAEAGNFGSLAAALYRLTNSERPLRGTVNAIARRAVRDFAAGGAVEHKLTAELVGLDGEIHKLVRSTVVASNNRRNAAGAAYDLARQVFQATASNGFDYLEAAGWKRAGTPEPEAETDGTEAESLV